MGRRFYLYPRKSGFYFAEIYSPSGERICIRSTGTKNRDDAAGIAAGWVKDGIPSKAGPVSLAVAEASMGIVDQVRAATLTPEDAEKIVRNLVGRGLVVGSFARPGLAATLALDFLRAAWADGSEFVREREAYGHRIGKQHIAEMAGILDRYWERTRLQGKRLVDLERDDVKDGLLQLKADGLSPLTVNKAFAAVSAPLRWAFREGKIPADPTATVKRFARQTRKRGIITADEAMKLAAYAWTDERARLAFLVAYSTGLRMGEILALRSEDLGKDRISVRHAWSTVDRLKAPKNGEQRIVPADPCLIGDLVALAKSNPHRSGAFVFWGTIADRPIVQSILVQRFYDALAGIGVSAAERKRRNIVFHSLRHGWATAMAERLTERLAMQGTGQKTLDVFRDYADHATEETVGKLAEAANDAFGKIVRFRRPA
jgi:integrase